MSRLEGRVAVDVYKRQIHTYLGEPNRKDALRDADFVVNAIQVGGYDPCTITDFELSLIHI